jgi:hypothetical protein
MADAETCPRCGARFECGMKAGRKRCWCADLPALQRAGGDDAAPPSCYCPACLKELLEIQAQESEAST